MKKYVSIILMCLMALSCSDKLAELEIVEFGAALVEKNAESLMPLAYRSGSFQVEVVSDGDFKAEIPQDCDWLWFDGSSKSYSGSGDVKITVHYDLNRAILRSETIVLARKHRRVEIRVSQNGVLSEDFYIAQQNLWTDAAGGQMSAKVLTISGPDDILIETEYVETNHMGAWIEQTRMENNYLKFDVKPNNSENARHAVITVSKKGTSLSGRIQVGQAAEGAVVQKVTVSELKAVLQGENSMMIEDNMVLTGIVLNDNLEGNGAENFNITSILQDLQAADRTLYVSDVDGANGVRIDFNKGEELLVKRFDHIEIALAGATLAKETDPDRYVVSGLAATAVMKNEPGSQDDVAIKEKTMSQLDDMDVYTLVTLTDCEMPVAKGPYIGIELSNYNIVNKYPMVIRDKEGTTMHMMVNTTCTWHRDGTERPKGSGKITGVIVHEHCDNFEWDQTKARAMEEGLGRDYVNGLGELVNGLGEIEKYQIRPIRKEDVALADGFEEGFSQLICEFTYKYSDAKQVLRSNYVETGQDTVLMSTGENLARMTLMNGNKKQKISSKRDWTLLGPYKDGEITDISTGNGIWCYGQKAAWFKSPSEEKWARTMGMVNSPCGPSWSNNTTDTKWSKNGCYWKVEFSTYDLKAENAPMSVQLGAVNGYGDRVGGPRNWKMVYCTSDSADEVEIARYTVPDFPMKGNRRVWHCPGHKYMSFTIPADANVWDKKVVTIKLIPVDDPKGDVGDTGDLYAGGPINESVENSLNYFAVRCNKL